MGHLAQVTTASRRLTSRQGYLEIYLCATFVSQGDAPPLSKVGLFTNFIGIFVSRGVQLCQFLLQSIKMRNYQRYVDVRMEMVCFGRAKVDNGYRSIQCIKFP